MTPLKQYLFADAETKHYKLFGYKRRIGQICITA
jgi:hypothetical protein